MVGAAAQSGDSEGAWAAAVNSARSMASSVALLEDNETEAVALLRGALRGAAERDAAILILGCLSETFVRALVNDLVMLALSHRNALAARQILGRLSHSAAAETVPMAVWSLLAEVGDYDSYRRMAELLKHLGLFDTLNALCRRAADSDDEDIREVAADFRANQ